MNTRYDWMWNVAGMERWEEFVEAISDKIEKGWVPVGNPFIDPETTYMAQAIYLPMTEMEQDMNRQSETITWHSMKEDPPKGEMCLIQLKEYDVIEMAYYSATGSVWITDTETIEDNDDIIAWAELPKGWKGDVG